MIGPGRRTDARWGATAGYRRAGSITQLGTTSRVPDVSLRTDRRLTPSTRLGTHAGLKARPYERRVT
jgi:hypothetical protein